MELFTSTVFLKLNKKDYFIVSNFAISIRVLFPIELKSK